MNNSTPLRALVSVSDKSNLDHFVTELTKLGFDILSTGGTARFLREHNIDVIDVSSYTNFPEILQGRVKTLHPKIHGAILGCPDQPDHAEALSEHDIVPFQLVICNLYPFVQTIAQPDVTVSEAIEQIDIGGPSMIRSAAKNHRYVGVVTDASQYEEVLQEFRTQGSLSAEFRRKLASAAFEMTAQYDRAISNFFDTFTHEDSLEEGPECSSDDELFPLELALEFTREAQLRYGENPHQKAAFYVEPSAAADSLAKAKQLHGKELSYNNLLDLDAALNIVREFEAPAASVIKHNNPCGCGIGKTLAEAFEKGYEGDPMSAFGSIIGFNREVDLATAEKLCEPGRFIEAIIAPDYSSDAFELLTSKPTWKKNVRLMQLPDINSSISAGLDYRRITGGLLVQERDVQPDPKAEWKVVTKRKPTSEEQTDLEFAWLVCKYVKSNAILLAKSGMVLGVGAGQMSRLDSSFIAAHKSKERSEGAVLASDAFFPFRDGIDEAATAGIQAVIQPGGSRRDEEVIEACNEHNMAMIFTGRRHFRH